MPTETAKHARDPLVSGARKGAMYGIVISFSAAALVGVLALFLRDGAGPATGGDAEAATAPLRIEVPGDLAATVRRRRHKAAMTLSRPRLTPCFVDSCGTPE